jgi:hypothetical protein
MAQVIRVDLVRHSHPECRSFQGRHLRLVRRLRLVHHLRLVRQCHRRVQERLAGHGLLARLVHRSRQLHLLHPVALLRRSNRVGRVHHPFQQRQGLQRSSSCCRQRI